MKTLLSLITILAILFAAQSCSDKASQPGDLPEPGSLLPDTTYIMVTPAWTEADGIPFNKPSDVKIGYDRYVYIADRDNDRVVKLSLAGEFVESYAVRYPTQVAQDRGLDLLVISDSSVILRRSYSENGDFEEVFVWPDAILPPPFDTIMPAAIFGIAASPFPDKSYLISNFYNHTCTFDSTRIDDTTYIVDTTCYDEGIYEFNSDDYLGGIRIPSGYDVGRVINPVCINTFDFI